jgi:very-short-patch-repair endonuclease
MVNLRPDYSQIFLTIWRELGGPPLEREYRFDRERRFRFDFAFPLAKVAIEIDGGAWLRIGHVHPANFARDLEKFNLATLAGWRVFRFTPEMFMRNPEVLRPVVELCKTMLTS